MAKNAKTGIATSVFKGHHTRAASTSAAAVCKVPFISTFMDNEDWSNDITFGKFYKKSIFPANKAYGQLLLENLHTQDWYRYFHCTPVLIPVITFYCVCLLPTIYRQTSSNRQHFIVQCFMYILCTID